MTRNIFGVHPVEESVTVDFYKGYVEARDIPHTIIDRIRGGCLGISAESVCGAVLPENSFVILQSNQNVDTLATISNGMLIHVTEREAYGIKAKNLEQVLALDCLGNVRLPLVTVTGVAGTGKTLLAIASAIANRKFYKKIIVCRPVMPMGKDIGFLPGCIDDKIGPYMAPLFDNLGVIGDSTNGCGKAKRIIDSMLETQKIVVEPITYIRGRSLKGCYVILDEAQNLTPHHAKTIVTRAGEGTKVALVGDITQIDTPGLTSISNGLSHVVDKMKGQELCAHVHLMHSERSPLAELAGRLL